MEMETYQEEQQQKFTIAVCTKVGYFTNAADVAIDQDRCRTVWSRHLHSLLQRIWGWDLEEVWTPIRTLEARELVFAYTAGRYIQSSKERIAKTQLENR